jgi:hypothetical protein
MGSETLVVVKECAGDMGTLVMAMEVPAVNLEKICMANLWC